MTVTINLTAILVVLIICVFLYAMCKMARKEETKNKNAEQKKVDFANSRNGIRAVPKTQEQGLREYVENKVKDKEEK